MTQNVLTLGNCAGLFHWSNSNYYFGTKEQNERHRMYYNALRKLHGGVDGENEHRTFNYTLDAKGMPVINFNGLELVCNDRMIETISGEFERCDIINNRHFANFAEMGAESWQINSYKDGDFSLWHKKFNSLSLDCFSHGLLFYRLSFKRMNVEFICSNNTLYLVGDQYREIDINYLLNRLDIVSKKAIKEVSELIAYIMK